MVKKAISQMKAGKAPGPSGIVVEMIRAAGDMGASMIRDLAVAIIRDGKVPSDWEQSLPLQGKRGRIGKGPFDNRCLFTFCLSGIGVFTITYRFQNILDVFD